MADDLAVQVAFLTTRVQRLEDIAASQFEMTRFLLWALHAKGVLTQEEGVALLRRQHENRPQADRESDRTLFQRTLMEMGGQPPSPGEPPKPKGWWVQGVIENERDPQSDR